MVSLSMIFHVVFSYYIVSSLCSSRIGTLHFLSTNQVVHHLCYLYESFVNIQRLVPSCHFLLRHSEFFVNRYLQFQAFYFHQVQQHWMRKRRNNLHLYLQEFLFANLCYLSFCFYSRQKHKISHVLCFQLKLVEVDGHLLWIWQLGFIQKAYRYRFHYELYFSHFDRTNNNFLLQTSLIYDDYSKMLVWVGHNLFLLFRELMFLFWSNTSTCVASSSICVESCWSGWYVDHCCYNVNILCIKQLLYSRYNNIYNKTFARSTNTHYSQVQWFKFNVWVLFMSAWERTPLLQFVQHQVSKLALLEIVPYIV